MSWGDDPELLSTFRLEVEDRLTSLQAGLLELERHPHPRQVVQALFRDAHTVKGSARMLGLAGVLRVAHGMEDLLGLLRDGRAVVRTDLVDLLLASCDGIGRALPGSELHTGHLDDAALEPLVSALASAVSGADQVAVPVLGAGVARAPAAPGPTAAPADRTPTPGPTPTPVRAARADDERPAGATSDSVRVAAAKVYDLLDAVGEAGLDARRVEQATGDLLAKSAEQARWTAELRSAAARSGGALPPEVEAALSGLVSAGDEVSGAVSGLRELVEGSSGGMALVRDGAMSLAMVPVRRAFAALPRLVRDVAQSSGRLVDLVLEGEEVELDKQVLDGVAAALKHLVINAVDHGCRPPAERRAAGRPDRCTVTIRARSIGATVVLEVADDGAGVDEAAVRSRAVALGLLPADTTLSGPPLLRLLFVPAFSTAPTVTATSGRGVGLDVVAADVEDLGGGVEVRTAPGVGTTFVLTLPVTLGVLRCLVARIGQERYAVPLPGVVESLSLRSSPPQLLAGAAVLVRDGVSIPLLDLATALGATGAGPARTAVVVRHGSTVVAWAVDRLEGEAELVVKDLGTFLGRVPHVAGATIDADGSVVCLLDLRELAASPVLTQVASALPAVPAAAPARRPRVLVVEDSLGVRELARVILEGAGFLVETAVDGLDGAARLRNEPADLVLSDVEMPGMDGFDLTRTIRRTRGWENVPVIIMTSRGEPAARQAGMDAGCSAYLLKNEFDQETLVSTARRLVGAP